jgi:monoamine oxidase
LTRVCVIGAGLAGLAAADGLAAAGAEVDVLEARNRVGGRVWSDRLATGALIERGGEFLTDGYTATERIAARLGCELVGMGIRYPDRRLHPDPGIDRVAALAAAAVVEREATLHPGRAAVDVLTETVSDPAIRELFASRVQSATAHPIDDLEAGFLLGVSYLMNDDECRRVAGGNQELARRLANALGNRLHLGNPAHAVTHNTSGVAVSTETGRIDADAVVVAVPIPLLRALEFDPPLPTDVIDAITAVRMSVAAKLAVPLRSPAPADAVMSVPGRFWAYTTPCDEIGSRTVGSWAGSAPVVAALEATDGPETWIGEITALWPELELDTDDATVTTWLDDPWAQGAYSVLMSRDENEPSPLSEPVGRIVFAGEHTSPDWSGTIEGALRSGARAAADVLRLVRDP